MSIIENALNIVRSTVNYASIAAMRDRANQDRKRGEKLTVKDFLVLAPGNDPFYADAPGTREKGEWFANLWRKHKGGEPTVHVRALHYALVGLVNTDEPVRMPNGKVYENTIQCWKFLELAGKYARYNCLLPADKFEDRREQSLYEAKPEHSSRLLWASNPSDYDFEMEIPKFPDLPYYYLHYQSQQRYRIEVWCEKSTQERVLMPIVQKYNVTMLSAQGELSISAMFKAIKRAEENNHTPTRILYISDFDPAGRSMPVAASRKIEFLQHLTGSQADIQLYPIALTHDQCVAYQLDRTPIKDSERRKGKFELQYGTGATELDALEAKHKGELAKLLEREILKFYDTDLKERTDDAREELQDELERVQDAVKDSHDISSLEDEYEQLKSEFEEWKAAKWVPFAERLLEAYQGIEQDLDDNIPDIEDYPLPEGREVETTDSLYCSTRDYLEQISAYSDFTGRFSHLIEDSEESDD